MFGKDFRPFKCSCGHKLRFAALRCGNCGARTPFQNRVEFWVLSGFAALIALGLIVGAFIS